MKKLFTIFAALLIGQISIAQYYIRGEVRDGEGNPLQNVKIYMPESTSLYSSGVSGGFGIPTRQATDSMIFSLDGYVPQNLRIKASEYQHIVLKIIPIGSQINSQKLVSITTGSTGSIFPLSYYENESYSNLAENDFIQTNIKTHTQFSMRIDKASYSNVRRFINQGTQVPVDAVRVDEMLNYFNFNYEEPKDDNVFNVESHVSDCPWNKEHRLLYLNLSAKKLNLDHVPPSNLVFLIDVSGSMDLPNRLPLLKQAFQLLVKNLRKIDTVSIVTYGGTVGIWLPPTSGAHKKVITKSIEALYASGDTPGEAAIRVAYKLAENTFIKNGNNRIILATDGDFNVGQNNEADLEDLIAKEKQSGVYLTCLGVGMGNYKDSKIEVLSKKGNGNFAYIDDLREAEKVLVTEFTQTMYSVASNVYVNAKFDPAYINQYRLIGYDNKKSIIAKNTSELEGGEIGSGSGNTVIFEILPSKLDSTSSKPINIADFQVHYRLPNDSTEKVINYPCPDNYISFNSLNKDLQFATAVAMFGLKLRESKYFPPELEWKTIKDIAIAAQSADNFLETEFIESVDKAQGLYSTKKKKGFWRKDKD
ncbi:MAG: von Willebrand factor type A domain-containing protein [Ginsengibacter sp.]